MSSRIAPRDDEPTHKDAIAYISEMFLAMRKVIDGHMSFEQSLRVITLSSEWKHSILECIDEFGYKEQVKHGHIPNHLQIVTSIQKVIDDFMSNKDASGLYPDYQEVTHERLDKLFRQVMALKACRKRVRFYR